MSFSGYVEYWKRCVIASNRKCRVMETASYDHGRAGIGLYTAVCLWSSSNYIDISVCCRWRRSILQRQCWIYWRICCIFCHRCTNRLNEDCRQNIRWRNICHGTYRLYHQLFTVFVSVDCYIFPVFFCLMTGKARSLYLKIFEKLHELVPEFSRIRQLRLLCQ